MAVASDWHRRGIGRALVDTVESKLRADGCRMLQVKTLGVPIEETHDLWPGTPCLLMVKTLPSIHDR